MQISVVLRFKEGEDFKGTLNYSTSDLVKGEVAGVVKEDRQIASSLWMIWSGYHRQFPESGDFDSFIESLDEFEILDEEVDPTKAASSP